MRRLLLVFTLLCGCGGTSAHSLGLGATCTAGGTDCQVGLLCCCTNCDVPLNHHYACETPTDGGVCPLSG